MDGERTRIEDETPGLGDELDACVQRLLGEVSSAADYWDFRRDARRDGLHGLTQYPAMMVPAMQGQLIDILCETLGDKPKVLDPFVGSGTTLVEAMRRGLSFTGQDINPLAVLISKTKVGPFAVDPLEASITRVVSVARADRRRKLDVAFPGLTKWFTPRVAVGLARLRRAIQAEEDLWIRRVLWVVLAETVRLTSNSRTSTFKLHIRPTAELEQRMPEAVAQFAEAANLALRSIRDELTKREVGGVVGGDAYPHAVNIHLGHTAKGLPGEDTFDLVVTSPPYGDGRTTVPYGQYSYLPLQWLDLADVDERAAAFSPTATHGMDTASLGGSCKHAGARVAPATARSPRLRSFLAELEVFPGEYRRRVASFFADLDSGLETIVPRVRAGGYMVWTVGNRRVADVIQPLDVILEELLRARGCATVHRLVRVIPNKRMATRNAISATMKQEHVLILRKGGA